MKIPRDLSADPLLTALRKFGYEVTRQTGSHIRVTTMVNGIHHEIIPKHHPIKVGTLLSILKSIANHHKMSIDELLKALGLN